MRTITHGKRRNPEAKLQAGIVKLLADLGCIVAVTDAGVLRKHGVRNRASGIPKGYPDLVASLADGRTLYIECKAPDGVITRDQYAIGEWLTSAGHTYILARSMGDVIDAIEEPTDG